MFDLEENYQKMMNNILEEAKEKQEWVIESENSLTYVFQYHNSPFQIKCTLDQQLSNDLTETNQRSVMVIKREREDEYIDYLLRLQLDSRQTIILTILLKENGLLKTTITVDLNGTIASFSAYDAIEKVYQTFEQHIKQDPAYRLHFAVHDVPFELREC